jgi:predicted phage baseplate assembly protein
VNEGAGWVIWDRRGSLLYDLSLDGRVSLSSAEARDYYTQFDENDVCFVIFGDGTFGRRPPAGVNNIRATYRIGGGKAGNVPANTITVARTEIKLGTLNVLDSVTNPLPAAGGADHEDIDHAKRVGPLAFRSGQRAVTLNDYEALALQAGGVAKVRGRAPNWNVIELYIAPEGDTLRTVPEELLRRLISYFEDKRMAGTFVEILNATSVPIEISIEIIYDKRYRLDAVRQAVEAAVQDLLAFKNVDFGQPLYLSDVYGKVESVAGVAAMTVTRFRREDAAKLVADEQLLQLGVAQLASGGQAATELAALLQRAIQIDVATDGRIDIKDFEIPVLGALDIEMTESPR